MLLHLVRHAHAVTEEENPSRPLSAHGRGEAARLARFFAGNGCFKPAQVWYSPLLRSRETADELIKRLALDAVVVETPGLLPEDDPHELAERLQLHPKDRGDLALVGHEPHLSALASLLVRGKESPALFTLKKGAVLTLESTDKPHKKSGLARWSVRWHVSPELLPAVTIPLTVSAAALPSPTAPAPSVSTPNPDSPAS
ncbi:MAG: histidine phosphatase family protein [Burkholderiales bacterium]|nr:histidine phosphatase family protein [Opitutaceae bacterium]